MKCLLSVIIYPQLHWSDCNIAQFVYRCSTSKLHLATAFSIPVNTTFFVTASQVFYILHDH